MLLRRGGLRTPISLLTTALLLCACAGQPSVTEHQCRIGDWENIGFQDGSTGQDSARLLHHQNACAAFAISPDRALYLKGWQAGLDRYCSADTGFELGARGAEPNLLCENGSFITAYEDGRRLFGARQDVRDANRALEEAHAELRLLERSIDGTARAQLIPELPHPERTRLLSEFYRLSKAHEALLESIPSLEAQVVATEDALTDIERDLGVPFSVN